MYDCLLTRISQSATTQACSSKTCNVVIKRHSKSVDPQKHCCGRCKSKLIEIEVPSSSDASKSVYTPKQQRKTSEFAMYVKEQTPHVRQRLATERNCKSNEVSQADVMKECGRMWRSAKEVTKDSLFNDGLDVMAGKLDALSLDAGSS
jgi:hypothetical protein